MRASVFTAYTISTGASVAELASACIDGWVYQRLTVFGSLLSITEKETKVYKRVGRGEWFVGDGWVGSCIAASATCDPLA